ncbi:MAG: carbohydrate ABC transporter permease [Clostridia bacterium]|nr:carbohydrate ABC transporter permease [Clostridia bacterium]
MNRKTKGEIVFDIFNNFLMLLVIVVMLYPFLNQIAISLSDNAAVMSGRVSVYPVGFTAKAYKDVMTDARFLKSFGNTVYFTIICTLFQVAFMAMYAYPLSKKYLKGNGIWMGLMVFSMMFGTGGLIPNYMLIKNLRLVNTYTALILPGAMNIWNIIVLKNFYRQIPDSIEESAMVDGANHFTTFIRIILPLSLPSLAAITLFTAVGAWNQFFGALIYITNPEKKLLQVYLRDILQAVIVPNDSANAVNIVADTTEQVNSESMKAATLMCSTIPILIVYPFVQKYFISGMMVGSVKG